MKLVVQMVVAQDMADVLAEVALDALAEFLDAVDLALLHAPGAVCGIGLARLERLDPRLDLVVPRDVGHEVPDQREGPHRLDRDRLGKIQRIQPRHAHQPRLAVDFRRARSALARLAVPPHGQVAGLIRLDAMHRVEHDHALADTSVG